MASQRHATMCLHLWCTSKKKYFSITDDVAKSRSRAMEKDVCFFLRLGVAVYVLVLWLTHQCINEEIKMADQLSASDRIFMESVSQFHVFIRIRSPHRCYPENIFSGSDTSRALINEYFRRELLEASIDDIRAAYDENIFSTSEAVFRSVARVLLARGCRYSGIVAPIINEYRK